ncbi:hypothetical protein B005_3887 [Nocardiopsis alba ATCC BAA-2165]|uniref:Uncharacterized protein n=1 Tax=Nocardiopsis alba (strain ATCC BAA-2165 / BE74) TaxID=1205910 RepID=J7L6N7_NOCAA|nr:hypothetical protein B005_3887 [Nocardiopsis alba ATCC BAA-2165]
MGTSWVRAGRSVVQMQEAGPHVRNEPSVTADYRVQSGDRCGATLRPLRRRQTHARTHNTEARI